MSSPYASVGPALVKQGYSAIPIFPGSKAPGEFSWGEWRRMHQWDEYGERLPTFAEVVEWSKWPRAGVGITLGPASGVVALDFDKMPEFWARIEQLIEPSPVVKRGENGYTAFYRFSGEPSRNWRVPDGQGNVVELLSIGRQTLIPPTIHPNTKRPYTWDDKGLVDFPQRNLPRLPENIIQLIDSVLERPQRQTKAAVAYERHEKESPEFIAAMLERVSPELDAETWLAIGSSIKSVYPDGTGFRLWNEWSSRDKRLLANGDPQYQPRSMERRWNSLDPDRNNVSIGTLRHFAEKGGFEDWFFDENRREAAELANVSPVIRPSKKKPESCKPETIILTLPDSVVHGAPGLVGQITRWITETAIKPQPVLSLAAALTAVAVLKGHRYRTETNLRTNIYALGLARSGSGKNHPLEAIRRLFSAAGCDALLGGEPASEPGLCQILRESPRSLLLWDEMGHAISGMCNPRAGSHYSQILSTLTRLFSEAGSHHQGKVLAAGSRNNIDQPCLSVLGLTVPERFFETLTHDHAIDGFLPRWLLFQVESGSPRVNRAARIDRTPLDILAQVRHLGERPRPNTEGGRLPEIVPAIVPFSTPARDMFWATQEEFDRKAEEASNNGEPTASVWARAAEHIAKLALVVSDNREITDSDLRWADSLVRFQCLSLCDSISRRIGQNQHERNTKKVFEIIRMCYDGISKHQLTRKTQWLTDKERLGIINTLVDSEQIAVQQQESRTKGSGRSPILYVAIR